jgi:hypothetical protein
VVPLPSIKKMKNEKQQQKYKKVYLWPKRRRRWCLLGFFRMFLVVKPCVRLHRRLLFCFGRGNRDFGSDVAAWCWYWPFIVVVIFSRSVNVV